jgi:hypothetical protein
LNTHKRIQKLEELLMSSLLPTSITSMSKSFYQGVKNLKPNPDKLINEAFGCPKMPGGFTPKKMPGGFTPKTYQGNQGQTILDLVRSHPELVEDQMIRLQQGGQSLEKTKDNVGKLLTRVRGDAEFKPKEAANGLLTKDQRGQTPLHYDVTNGPNAPKNPFIPRILADANIDTVNKDGYTALQLASKRTRMKPEGSTSGVQQLLANGAKPNIKGPGGKTALHEAADVGTNVELVKALLKAGADKTIPDARRKTPFDIVSALDENEFFSNGRQDLAKVRALLKPPSLTE